MARGRATTPTTRKRVEDVLRIMLEGAEAWDVRQYVAEQEQAGKEPWAIPEGGSPLSERQVRRYARKADAAIETRERTQRRHLFALHLARRRNLYTRAVQAGELRTALAILSDIAKMLGLYQSEEDRLRREVEALRRQLDKVTAGQSSGDEDVQPPAREAERQQAGGQDGSPSTLRDERHEDEDEAAAGAA